MLKKEEIIALLIVPLILVGIVYWGAKALEESKTPVCLDGEYLKIINATAKDLISGDTYPVKASIQLVVNYNNSKAQITANVMIEPAGGKNIITYGLPYLDLEVVGLEKIYKWSNGKAFAEVIEQENLPMYKTLSMEVNESCIREVTVFINNPRLEVRFMIPSGPKKSVETEMSSKDSLTECIRIDTTIKYRDNKTLNIKGEITLLPLNEETIIKGNLSSFPPATSGTDLGIVVYTEKGYFRWIKNYYSSEGDVERMPFAFKVSAPLTNITTLKIQSNALGIDTTYSLIKGSTNFSKEYLLQKQTTLVSTQTQKLSSTIPEVGNEGVEYNINVSERKVIPYPLASAFGLVIALAAAIIAGALTYIALRR